MEQIYIFYMEVNNMVVYFGIGLIYAVIGFISVKLLLREADNITISTVELILGTIIAAIIWPISMIAGVILCLYIKHNENQSDIQEES